MNSLILKRSITINGHKTSVSLEDAFWSALKEIAIGRGMTPSELVTSIEMEREQINLSSCLRVFVLNFYVSRPSQRSERAPSREASVATTDRVDGESTGIP
jgi:predicted DNA-binding ribbon-helix-helix protein